MLESFVLLQISDQLPITATLIDISGNLRFTKSEAKITAGQFTVGIVLLSVKYR